MNLSTKAIMCSMFVIALCSVFTIVMVSKVQENSSSDYKAGVVEYHRILHPPGTPSDAILMDNVKRYAKFILENKENLDIIVFPESTLTNDAYFKARLDMLNYSTIVPDPSNAVDVCESNNFPQFFVHLACLAKEAKVYLVVNLIEQKLCHKTSYYGEFRQCSDDAWNFYNTDVVFDRNGKVIARYRKYHLFGEIWLNRTVFPESSIFETDFGIKFGLFTCFDILFKKPPMDLVKLHGVNHIIYPTMWYSELPFLTALQAQLQWAYELDATLLTAGANNCTTGSGGTGIFQGRMGAVISDYPENGESKIYISSLNKTATNHQTSIYSEEDIDREAKKMDKFYLMKENLSAYTIEKLSTERVIDTVVCSDKDPSRLCCQFYIKRDVDENSQQHYHYYMIVHQGIRSFKDIARAGLEICGIIACTNETASSCGERFPNYDDIAWPIKFTEMSIRGNFSYVDNKIQYPNSLLANIRPLPSDAMEWEYKIYNGNIIERTLSLKKPQNRLLTFAIFGRDFSKDFNIRD